MFDPRSDIISLFSNSRIGANSRYGSSATVYVKLIEYDIENAEIEPNDYGDRYVGIMWLMPPRAYNRTLDIGFNTTEHTVVIDCRLILPQNNKWLKNIHSTYINSVLHTFETTIRTNGDATAGKSWDIAELNNMPVSNDPENPNIHYRVLEVVCVKAD